MSNDIVIPPGDKPASTPQNSNNDGNQTGANPSGYAPANKTVAEEEAAKKAALEAELEAPYYDKKEIVLSSVRNYSAYRQMNRAALGKPNTVIGSSVRSVRILLSSKGEVNKYYPELIGLSSNHPDFIMRVKQYLNNIFFDVKDGDAVLNCSFRYDHKRDYLKVKAEEDKILAKYEATNRGDEAALYKAACVRDEELTRLEQTKYQYGTPDNIAEYIIYRHCLNYPDVAKDEAFVNSNNNLRFYIKDKNKEENRKQRLIKERQNALKRFVELQANPTKFNAVYIGYCRANSINMADALIKSNLEQIDELTSFVQDNPKKFNSIVTDKNIMEKAFIEMLILRGELVRSDYNQQINTPDGQFIGANMNDAIAFFANPNNAGLKTKLESKLKLI